jgi:non-ribosomal peptide synthetase component E (peptide arylation enzyme)
MRRFRFPVEGVRYHSPSQAATHCQSGAWIWASLGSILREAAIARPDHPFVIAGDGCLTFSELDQSSESVAASLLEIGLKPGDRAIFQVGTVKELVVALFGCFKAAVIPVCTLPQYREIEIGQLARASEAKAYFVQADFSTTFDLVAFARSMMRAQPMLRTLIVVRGGAETGERSLSDLASRYSFDEARARTVQADALPGDVALFQLSGGSTGIPKIIPRMHAEYLGSAAAWNARQGLGPNDISLWALPLIHNAGMLLMLIPSLLARRPLVIQARFEVEEFVAAISRHRVTYTGSIGPIAANIINRPARVGDDFSSLRMMFALARADALEERIGIPSQQMYGITEGVVMGSYPNADIESRHATMGWPTGIGDQIRLLEPGTETEVSEGDTGELCFRGPYTLCGYFDATEITAESFTSDGFFRSGDLMRIVFVDGQRRYCFEGRLRDNINRGGEKFGAEEVETVIGRHPAVNDVRVVSMPDPVLIERACAFLVTKPGHLCPSVAALGSFLREQGLAKFKWPERIEHLFEFPVTRVGKVDKQALRRIIADKIKREQETAVVEATP